MKNYKIYILFLAFFVIASFSIAQNLDLLKQSVLFPFLIWEMFKRVNFLNLKASGANPWAWVSVIFHSSALLGSMWPFL